MQLSLLISYTIISICVLFRCTRNLLHSSFAPSSLGERGGDNTCGVEHTEGVESSKLSRLYSKFLSSVECVDVDVEDEEVVDSVEV